MDDRRMGLLLVAVYLYLLWKKPIHVNLFRTVGYEPSLQDTAVLDSICLAICVGSMLRMLGGPRRCW
jgi:hypothetical protein